MNLKSLISLGRRHAFNFVAEQLYLHGGPDLTRPINFYALVNERCNARCAYCVFWRRKPEELMPELSIEQWKNILASIRDFVGTYSINFSGGEPLLKPGFLDLLAWCGENGVHAGVTTNGSLLRERTVKELVAARPFNVNISVDAPNAAIHDRLRGLPGLFDKIVSGLRLLRTERDARGASFPIIIKPTVCKANFRLLPELTAWARENGATAISPQPMEPWGPEEIKDLWIGEDDMPEFERTIDTLVAMKTAGEPILTGEETLSLFPLHFKGGKAPRENLPCRVGLRDMFIMPNGDVRLCFLFPSAGNISRMDARALWRGEQARKVRADTLRCQRLCLLTCTSQKTLGRRVRMALTLLRGNR